MLDVREVVVTMNPTVGLFSSRLESTAACYYLCARRWTHPIHHPARSLTLLVRGQWRRLNSSPAHLVPPKSIESLTPLPSTLNASPDSRLAPVLEP